MIDQRKIVIEEKKKRVVDKKIWKPCHFIPAGIRRANSPYWSHQKENDPCSSVICDDLNDGMTIEQIWRKDYKCGTKFKGE
jgi:hypothetical protein